MSALQPTHAYILIRTKLNLSCANSNDDKHYYFRECLESALKQTYEHKTIIILQDSSLKFNKDPHRHDKLPAFIQNIVAKHNAKEKKDLCKSIYFYSCNSKGAAQSLFNIREIVINDFAKGENRDEDIVILLDDDDMLFNTAVVKNIVDRMNDDKGKADICLTQFDTIGENSLNIINQGGNVHNTLIQDLSLENIVSPETETKSYGRGSLCFADSLGWTKVYRVKVVKEYHKLLREIFGNKEGELKCFLKRNDAFEDFPEIINLCIKGFTTTALNKTTHIYRKHKKSITAKRRKTDFVRKRVEYLTLLIQLYNKLKEHDRLLTNSDVVVARYTIIKVITIENILARIRSEHTRKNRIEQLIDKCIHRWGTNSHNGSFVKWFTDCLHKKSILPEFVSLVKDALINGDTKYDYATSIIEEACTQEAKKGYVDVCYCFSERSTIFQTNRLADIWKQIAILICIICIAGVIGMLITGTKEIFGIATIIGVIQFTYNTYKTTVSENDQEDKLSSIFSNAVDDLARHIVAGYLVLHKIQQELTHSTAKPAKVHFSNLKVPQQTLLMSDEFDKYLVVHEFKNIPRLRANIRNINNSAEYMMNIIDDKNYNPAALQSAIEWEMRRYVGYFVNFMFFKENHMFRFPNPTERDIYLRTHHLYKDFVKIAGVSANDYDSAIKDLRLEERYEEYCKDRGNDRFVLFV